MTKTTTAPSAEGESPSIYRGDAREIIPTLDLSEIGAVVTDPPYGVALSSGMGGSFGDCRIEGDEDASVRDEVLAMLAGIPMLVFGSWRVPRPPGTKAVLIWEKGNHVGMGDLSMPWKPNTEEIYVIGSGFSGHRGSSVIKSLAIAGTVAQVSGRYHPTEKPVGLMAALIEKCPPGVILDPFMGSGSTLVAAQNVGRKSIGIEMDQGYVDSARARLRQLSLLGDVA